MALALLADEPVAEAIRGGMNFGLAYFDVRSRCTRYFDTETRHLLCEMGL